MRSRCVGRRGVCSGDHSRCRRPSSGVSTSSGSGVGQLGLGRALGLFGEEAVTVDDGGREIDQLAVIGA